MSNINTNNSAARIQESRELLSKLLEFERPFQEEERQKQLLGTCLGLFDKAEFAFNQVQLTILIQICSFAILSDVKILKIAGSLENELYLAIGRVSLKVIYEAGKDLYRAEARNTSTDIYEKFENLYFDEFGNLLQSISSL